MAIVVVQVGQCGNQLGDELFMQLYTSSKGSSSFPSPFFAQDGKARCVLVDSEPKVVQGVAARHSKFIRTENVVGGQSGRGNNWGLGYYGVQDPHNATHSNNPSSTNEARSPSHQSFIAFRKDQRAADGEFLRKSLRAIHLESWRTSDCETFEAIVLVHSLAGGTGSGFASLLAEKIRYYFIQPPEEDWENWDEVKEEQARRKDGLDGMLVEKRRAKYLLSIAVAPQSEGELATQSINATLSLHILHRCADAILLLRNGDVMPTPGGALAVPKSAYAGLVPPCTTFKEANEVFVALLLPVFGYGRGFGSLDALIPQAIPCYTSTRAGPSWRASSAPVRLPTNNILSLVPTPQGCYGTWRGCAWRGRFYAIQSGKAMLPGCQPTVPWQTILAPSAWGSARLPRETPDRGRVERHRQEERKGGAGQLRQRRLIDSKDPLQRCFPSPRSHREGGEIDLGSPQEGEPASSSEDSDAASCTFAEVSVHLPAELQRHYVSLKRSPVERLARSLEGVMVLNQTRELNATVLFPLLSSAALKVKMGAFLHMYEEAGVSAQRIEKAYQELAGFLSESEDL
ncbi:unnamed protein product [Phytomonas sp. Hart1]|nr:unnamed protein product [Phytomonas sp. Hart1]|eukprot:CCW67208.1 unnamed protein product [Phytomonas sp. isolate Hart1]